MKTKYVQVGSQRIAYYESEGTGSTMLFVHGNSASGRTFQHQLEGSLGHKYRIIAMDLPGHGDSDPASDLAAYGMPGYAKVVTAVAQALNATDAILVGWSLGGHIVLEAHNLLPHAAGFVIYGTPPLAFPPAMEEAFLPNPAVNVGFTPDVTEEQAHAYASAFFRKGSSVDPAPFVADVMKTDGQARAGLAASIVPDGYQDEVKIVAELTRPLTILHGKGETLVNDGYIAELTMPTLWRGAIQYIEDAGHAVHWEQPEQFNNLLAAFAEDIA
ncbi:Hydrolase, alpha/beta fold family [hydrothermal vent metagenome]|uniref:Hydrolase, alpha/beta fold family n=1 Tax=hydrothermal vent metagenome TaxID=652676 RepID=A0A3B0W1Q0_9ZZZZ